MALAKKLNFREYLLSVGGPNGNKIKKLDCLFKHLVMKLLCSLLIILFSINIGVGQTAFEGDKNGISADSILKLLNEYSSKMAIEMESWSP